MAWCRMDNRHTHVPRKTPNTPHLQNLGEVLGGRISPFQKGLFALLHWKWHLKGPNPGDFISFPSLRTGIQVLSQTAQPMTTKKDDLVLGKKGRIKYWHDGTHATGMLWNLSKTMAFEVCKDYVRHRPVERARLGFPLNLALVVWVRVNLVRSNGITSVKGFWFPLGIAYLYICQYRCHLEGHFIAYQPTDPAPRGVIGGGGKVSVASQHCQCNWWIIEVCVIRKPWECHKLSKPMTPSRPKEYGIEFSFVNRHLSLLSQRCLEILPVCIGCSPCLHCSDIPPMQFMVCRSIFLIKQSSGKSLHARRVACLAGRSLHISHQCSWKPKAHHIMKFWEVFTVDMVAAKRSSTCPSCMEINTTSHQRHGCQNGPPERGRADRSMKSSHDLPNRERSVKCMFFLSVQVPKLRTRGACQAESAEALQDTDTKTQNDNDIIMIRYGWLAWCPPAILSAWRNVVLTCRLLTTRNHRKLKKNQQVSMLWKATKAVLNISKWFDSNLTQIVSDYLVFLSFLAGRWGSNHKWLPWPSAHHQLTA